MKNVWIGVLLFFVLSPFARASHWLRLTRHDDTEIYVDDASVSRRGKLMQAWDRTDYPSPQTMTFPPFKQYRSMMALGYYNCAEKAGALREIFFYADVGGSGEVVGHVTIPVDALEFKAMASGTVGAVLLKYVCGNN